MPIATEEESRSKNPLYNRELLKDIMGYPSMEMPQPEPTVDTKSPPKAAPVQAATPKMSWSEVPEEAVKNIGPSLLGVGESMVAPIMHPLDTATAIGALGKGAYSKAKGALGYEQEPSQKAKEEASLNAVIDFYKQRYGTEEGLKEALAKDPAGVAADLSTFLTGGGSAAARLPGKLAKVGEAAQYIGKAGPIGEAVQGVTEAATKGLAKVASAPTSGLFSFATGKPFKTLQDAARAGFEHNPEFIRHLAGEGSPDEIVNRVEGAISTIADNRSKNYIAGMKDPTASQVPLGYNNIDTAIQSSVPKFTHLGKVYNQEAKNAFDKAVSKVDEWRNQPTQPGAHTIEDMDKLKRSLDEIHVEYSKDFGADSPAAKVVSDIRRSVFDTIKAQDPRYAEVMEKYADASRQLKEMRKDLLGGRSTTVGSKMRKMLSKGGDKAHKEELMRELEKIDPDIGYALAGHELSSFIPQGLVGRIMAGGLPLAAGAMTFNPFSIGAAAAASPMLAGATQYGIGATLGLPSKVSPAIPYFAGEMRERNQRASGGRTGSAMTADKLIAMAERAKNKINSNTKSLLEQPDEVIVSALKVAHKHI